ncbi:MAG TPA: lipopolysaccharide biosynthesis protein [Lysobacter sp.]
MSELPLLIAVACVSAAGTWLARAYALRRRLVDEPGERRSHLVATPRGGGAGPVVAIVAALLVMSTHRTAYAGAALAIAAVAAIGSWDDHRPLPARWRLLVHVAAGLILAAAVFGPSGNVVAIVGTVAAVAVLVNVWNFMDGINGIAASQAALVAATVACLVAPSSVAALVVAVACLAFLPFNFPKARIFLGDVGSGALGVALALLCCEAYRVDPPAGAVLLLPLSGFLVDAGLTLLRRILRGERWWEPHTQHLYQALARRYGHAPVTLGYAGWTLVAGAAAVFLGAQTPGFISVCLFAWYTGAAVLWVVAQRSVAAGRGRTGEKDR